MFLIFNFRRYGSSSSFPLIHYVPKIQVAVLDWKPNGLEKEGLWTFLNHLVVQFMTNVWKYVPCESKRELKFFPSPPSLTRALHTETSRASSVQFDEDHQCTMSRQTFSSSRPVCSVLCGSGGGSAAAAPPVGLGVQKFSKVDLAYVTERSFWSVCELSWARRDSSNALESDTKYVFVAFCWILCTCLTYFPLVCLFHLFVHLIGCAKKSARLCLHYWTFVLNHLQIVMSKERQF